MGLKITDISLHDFRSYPSFDLADIEDLTIFVGPNGAGKTNIIEAIQLLTSLNSFRSSRASELVRQGEGREHARAQISVTDGNRLLEIRMDIESNRRKYRLNDKTKRGKDLRGLLPAITFTPDDMEMIKGSDRFRRRELDLLGSQINANYYQILRDFEKIQQQKMRLLKDDHLEITPDMLAAVNEVFAKVAVQLTQYRSSLFTRLFPKIQDYYRQITNGMEELEGDYISICSESAEETVTHLSEIAQDEIRRKRSLIGPHLDRIELTINGMSAPIFASQGQQRSIVLSTKLAEADLVEELLDQHPILLLDDVMSELDGERRKALVKQLLQDKQTFITTANIQYFDQEMLERARIVELLGHGGSLSP